MERIINARVQACITEAIALTDNDKHTDTHNKLKESAVCYYDECKVTPTSETSDKVTPIKKAATRKKVAKKKVAKKAVSGDTKGNHTLLKTITDLPDGDVELVKAPFHLLEALPIDKRIRYISGLVPGDFITAENLAQAVKDGAKKNIAIQIIEHQKAKPFEIENPVTKFPQKTERFIANAIEIMGAQGGDLFNHMTRNGANKEVLLDFKAVAVAVRKGQV